MAFVTVEDLYGTAEIIVFESAYLNAKGTLVEENIVLVDGRLSIREDDRTTIIANEIAKTQNNLNYEGVIEKIKDNKMQSTLNRKERIENVKNAYKTREKEIIFDKNIVLFDDVYTTRCNSK